MRAIVLRTAGTNCDQETAMAIRLAGGAADTVHINELVSGRVTLEAYDLLIIPGGFSYGDDIGAGKILANELRYKLEGLLQPFVAAGKRIIGICNGFQVLVKAGYLPGGDATEQTVTLMNNDSGRFQCQWVTLKREKSAAGWLNQTETDWELPIAHGEGKFVTLDGPALEKLEKRKQVVFRYTGVNPNGSQNRIAGICNPSGNVLGLMPHPERHVQRFQHPEWSRRVDDGVPVGLQFFQAAVNK